MEASLEKSSAPSAMPKWVWVAGGAVALTAAGLAGALTQAHRAQAPAMPQAAVSVPAAPLDMPEPPKVAKAETPAPRHEPTPRAEAPAAPVCHACGVVESVQAVRVKGEGSGVGAVAGGVVGGVVGNQFGKGNGRKAMTVLGAVGGGFAGHEVEKQVKAKTVYSVKVRMEDGTLRTVQQAQAPAVGAKVKVEGSRLSAV